MPSRFGNSYQISVLVLSKLEKRGVNECNKCGIVFKLGDNVIRTTRKMYHEDCLKRIE